MHKCNFHLIFIPLLDAVGLDDKNEQSSAESEHAVKKEMENKKARREHEKRELHEYKESERQNIRDKYQLNKNRTASGSSPKRSKTTSKDENKCSIC